MVKCVCDVCEREVTKVHHIDVDLYNEGPKKTDNIKIEFDLCEYHYNMIASMIVNIDCGTAKKTLNPNG